MNSNVLDRGRGLTSVLLLRDWRWRVGILAALVVLGILLALLLFFG